MNAKENILSRIWSEHRYEESRGEDQLRRWANTLMMAIAAGSVLLFFYEELTSDPAPWLFVANIALDILFLCDYVLRIIFSGFITVRDGSVDRTQWRFTIAKENYLVRWYGLVDVVAVAPPLIYHTIHIGLAIGEFTRIARLLRLLRLARMLRVVKALRFLRETLAAQKSFFRHNRKIGTEVKAAFVVIGLVVMGSSVILHLLDEQNPDFGDLGNSVYFSTLSLFGQGNMSILQSFGMRITGLAIIFCGLALIGIVTGSFTTLLMERVRMHTSGNRPYHGHGHILICGFSHILPEMLGLLAQANESRDIVLLFDRGQDHEVFIEEGEYPCTQIGRPLSLHWIRGRASDIELLRRAHAEHSSHVVLLNESMGTRDLHEDGNANSLLALVQLRWLLHHSADKRSSREALPVTVQYEGRSFEHNVKISGEFSLDTISVDAETAEALGRTVPSKVTDVLVCGMNASAPLLINALCVRTPPCNVRVLCPGDSVYVKELNPLAKVQFGSTHNADDLRVGFASNASCIVLLADEGARTEADADAHTLQTYAALQAVGMRAGALVVAQIFQDSVGSWIESTQTPERRCIAIRTDLSVARAVLRSVADA